MGSDNTLIVYSKVDNPLVFAEKMAPAVLAIIGCGNKEAAMGIALDALCKGLTIVEWGRKHHWIPGKGPSDRSDSLLAEFRMNYGGKYKIIEDSTKRCEIEFTDKDGATYNRVMTRTDMMLSRTVWGKQPHWSECVKQVRKLLAEGKTEDQVWLAMQSCFKDNWGTENDWATMMFHRLVSSSLRKICPELAAGVYTPEELEDIPSDTPAATPAKPVTATEWIKSATVATEVPVETGFIDAEFTIETEAPQVEEPPFEIEPQRPAWQDARELFEKAFGEQAKDKIAQSCAARNVLDLQDMDEVQLREIITKLTAHVEGQSKN